MERTARRIAGYILVSLSVLIEVVHAIKVFDELIPEWLRAYITLPIAVAICLAGIVCLFLGYRVDAEPAPAVVPPSPQIKQEANPVNTFSPTITINNTPPAPPPLATTQSSATPPEPATQKPIALTHNVQYIRVEKYRSSDRHVALYENVPIANQQLKRFSNVKAKIEYKNFHKKNTLLTIHPGAWADRDDLVVYMGAGEPYYLTLAVFANNQWNAAEATSHGAGWGGMVYEEEYHPLPIGDLLVTVTLVGDHGLSIPPDDFHVQILANGAVNIRHLPGTQS